MDDEIVTMTAARYKRSDYMDETGIPSHGVDLVYIEEDHDLTWAVLPLWDQAGIVYQCYSQGGGGDMMMIRDEDRYEEAKDIAYRAQLELEARHLRRMGEVVTGKSVPMAIGSCCAALRTFTIWFNRATGPWTMPARPSA
jgi:hypothetical protein